MNNFLHIPERSDTTAWLVDIVIALGAFGFACLQLTLSVNLLFPDEMFRRSMGIESVMPTAEAFFATALTTLPLALRRRFPWPTLIVVVGLWFAMQVSMPMISLSFVGPLIALFTVASVKPLHDAAVVFLVGTATVVLASLASSQTQTLVQLSLFQNIALSAAAALAGYALHEHEDHMKAVEERAEAAERTRETEAQRRVEEERVRIAREVHDITAHSLSAVSIQAAAAERLIDRNPEAARESIAQARQISKTALEEIRAMIGVLRSGEESAETAPTAGTDRMADLVAYLEGAGVQASLDMVHYAEREVPAYIDVALFGIAREAATNIVRHAQASKAIITLRTIDRAGIDGTSAISALLQIEDDGKGFVFERALVDGHGIEGMQERVKLLGGTFSTGRSSLGGFQITAEVPLSQAPSPQNG